MLSPTQLQIRDACLRYAFYSELIKSNATLMCNNSANYGDLCAERMAEFSKAERDMLGYATSDEAPKELKRFSVVSVNKNNACSSCWLSSRVIKSHFDCCVRIHQYFYEREIFRKWVNSLLMDMINDEKPKQEDPLKFINELCTNYKARIPFINYHIVYSECSTNWPNEKESIVFTDANGWVSIDKDMKLTITGNVSEDILNLAQMSVPSLLRLFGENK